MLSNHELLTACLQGPQNLLHLLVNQHSLMRLDRHPRWRWRTIVVPIIVAVNTPNLRFGICWLLAHSRRSFKDSFILYVIDPTLRVIDLEPVEGLPCANQTAGDRTTK